MWHLTPSAVISQHYLLNRERMAAARLGLGTPCATTGAGTGHPCLVDQSESGGTGTCVPVAAAAPCPTRAQHGPRGGRESESWGGAATGTCVAGGCREESRACAACVAKAMAHYPTARGRSRVRAESSLQVTGDLIADHLLLHVATAADATAS